MKNVGIYTLNGNYNYGNRLQNYALNTYLNKFVYCKTLWKTDDRILYFKQLVKSKLFFLKRYKRESYFCKFTISYIKPKYVNKLADTSFDKYIVGSDQVWNVNFPEVDQDMFLKFSKKSKNISYSASIGISEIPKNKVDFFINGIENISYISVREEKGKEIIEELTGRKDVYVLVDPTMLLTIEEWDKVSKKPKMLKNDKYILNYFLGELSKERKEEIERIARENDCEIINLLDKNSPFYVCGPSEFLYLEKHAFLICTDSFHSSVFAILYNRPFVIFDREEKGMENMGSRLDTLINKFKLKNRRYNGKNITKENLEHDYSEAYKILEKERKKSDEFLREALDICGDKNER